MKTQRRDHAVLQAPLQSQTVSAAVRGPGAEIRAGRAVRKPRESKQAPPGYRMAGALRWFVLDDDAGLAPKVEK